MLNPVHLRTLAAVLSTGSFADAATSLGYTASAVSQQMSALEQATGLALFERFPRKIKPTHAARYLVDVGSRIVSSLQSLERDAAALSAGTQGEIRLGTFATASARILPPALVNLRQQYPRVEVLLEEGEPNDLLPLLLEGPLDIALVYADSADVVWPASLTAVPLLIEQRLLLLPPNHPLRGSGDTVDLRHLRDATWVTSRAAPCLEALCASVGFAPRRAFSSDDFNVIYAFVQAGLGVSLLPEIAHPPHIELSTLQVVPTPPRRHVIALYRNANQNAILPSMLEQLIAAADGVRLITPRAQ